MTERKPKFTAKDLEIQRRRENLRTTLRLIVESVVSEDGYWTRIISGMNDSQRSAFYDVVSDAATIQEFGITSQEQIKYKRGGSPSKIDLIRKRHETLLKRVKLEEVEDYVTVAESIAEHTIVAYNISPSVV